MEDNKTNIQKVLPVTIPGTSVNDNEHVYESFVLFQKFMDSFMQVSQQYKNNQQQPQQQQCIIQHNKEKCSNNVNNSYIIKDDDRPIRHSSINFVELVEKNLKELKENGNDNNNTNISGNVNGSKHKWRCNSSENINTYYSNKKNNNHYQHSRVHSSSNSNNNSMSVIKLQYKNSNNNVLPQYKPSSPICTDNDDDSNDIIYNYSSN